MRRALPFLLLTSLFVPLSSARSAEKPCGFAAERPAFVCGRVSSGRAATAYLGGKGIDVVVSGFQVTRATGPDPQVATTDSSGACFEMETPSFFAVECGIPIVTVIDPALQTATLKGTWSDKHFGLGKVVFDITFEGMTPGAAFDPGAGSYADCASGYSGAGLPLLHRHASAKGKISFEKKFSKVSASSSTIATLESFASASAVTITQGACSGASPERSPGRIFSCGGFGTPDPVSAFVCGGASLDRIAAMTTKTSAISVWLGGSLSVAPMSALDAELPGEQHSACLTLLTSHMAMGTCSYDDPSMLVEIDPALRTAHVRATFDTDFPFDFGHEVGFFDFGRVRTDVTFTAAEAAQRGDGPNWGADSFCGFSDVTLNGEALTAQAPATGSIAFTKTYGTLRGTTAKPFNGALGVGTNAFVFSEADVPCGELPL